MKFDGKVEEEDEDKSKMSFFPPNNEMFFKNDELGYQNIEIFAGEKSTVGRTKI